MNSEKVGRRMYFADFLIAHVVPDTSIRAAFAAALAVDANKVSVWPVGQVMDRSATVIVQTSNIGGDFRFQMSVTISDPDAVSNAERKGMLLDIVRSLANKLQMIVVTDDAGVNPAFDDDFLLVAPNGATEVVQADLNAMEEDSIVLVPESRLRYEAMELANHPVTANR